MIGRLFHWLTRKGIPAGATRASMAGGTIDAYQRRREPTARELMAELKATAWTCATINAGAVASHQPRLYIKTAPGQPRPKCKTISAPHVTQKAYRLGADVEEVLEHPLLTLLCQVNPYQNAFDLWELTTLYQEITGSAYWLIEQGPLGTPVNIWLLPSHCVTPERETDSKNLVDYYSYRSGSVETRYSPEEVISFSYPDPKDPYLRGYSPLRACIEQVRLASEYAAFRTAKFANHALPDAILSPEEVIGEEERDRLEMLWNQRMRRGGAGKVIVAESKLHMSLLAHSMGDLALLADAKATKEDIALTFGVPQPYVSGETNLANLQAAREQHGTLTLRPRIRRRDERLNERLVPLYDDTGRLFLWTEDPVPEDQDFAMRRRNSAVQLGYMTPNEARGELGLAPIAGGDALQANQPKEPKEPKPDVGLPPQRDGDGDGEAGEGASE